MKVIDSELFFSFAWDDFADVKQIVAQMEFELNVKISTPMDTGNDENVSDDVMNRLANSDIFILFVSEISKENDFVKRCVVRARNLNKNIIPVQIGKSSLFSSMPPEFKFRIDMYEYDKEDSRAKLFAQLKAALGMSVCSGDSYGRLYHVVTDIQVRVIRYGEDLGMASPNSDFQIRLTKGSQMLIFRSVEDDEICLHHDFEVRSNDGEDFINVKLREKFEQQVADKKRKRAEELKAKEEQKIRDQYESERIIWEEGLKNEAQSQMPVDNTYNNHVETISTYSSKKIGCFILFAVLLAIIFPWTLLITIPVGLYKFFK